MILSDTDIALALADGTIGIEDNLEKITGASLDMRLSPHLIYYVSGLIDSRKKVEEKDLVRINFSTPGYFDFEPGKFYLASTIQAISFPSHIAGLLYGRSSLARMGMSVHFAGFIDPGFEGTITLEIQNIGNNPVRLYVGQRICQMVFIKTTSPTKTPYNKKKDSKYMGQELPRESRVVQDWENLTNFNVGE